jgi:hypothetical protein
MKNSNSIFKVKRAQSGSSKGSRESEDSRKTGVTVGERLFRVYESDSEEYDTDFDLEGKCSSI